MSDDKLNEILDFAINGEKEAVQFYRSLQDIARFEHQKKTLKEIEQMEQGHVAFLETVKAKGFSQTDIPEVADLHISDYLVEAPPVPDMDYQDILIIAMKREESAVKLYTKLSNDYKDPDVKDIFKKLASEEAKHKLHFETIYDDDILEDS